jgi:hypothetical protein
MERRQDTLFREVVDQVQPSLVSRDFALYDRGSLGEYRWVEFARMHRGSQPPLPGQRSVVLYHLADHQHVGARLQERGLSGSLSSRRLAGQLWEYQPGTRATVDGRELRHVLRDWVVGAVDAPGN